MSPTTEALTSAVDAANGAIFAYGVATAFTTGEQRNTIGVFIGEQRVTRTSMNEALVAAGGTECQSQAGYTLPEEVTDATSAMTVLLAAEEDCAAAYVALAEHADSPDLRRSAVGALTGSALRASHWRAALNISPVTVAFPGLTRTG